MRKIAFLISFSCVLGFGQVVENKPAKLTATGMIYPDFGDGSRYLDSKLSYDLGNGYFAEIGRIYFRNGINERLIIPVSLRKFISKKTYLFGGAQTEWQLISQGLGVSPPRFDMIFGIGHEIKEGWFIEAKVQMPLNDSPINPLGSERLDRSFMSLGSRVKF